MPKKTHTSLIGVIGEFIQYGVLLNDTKIGMVCIRKN